MSTSASNASFKLPTLIADITDGACGRSNPTTALASSSFSTLIRVKLSCFSASKSFASAASRAAAASSSCASTAALSRAACTASDTPAALICATVMLASATESRSACIAIVVLRNQSLPRLSRFSVAHATALFAAFPPVPLSSESPLLCGVPMATSTIANRSPSAGLGYRPRYVTTASRVSFSAFFTGVSRRFRILRFSAGVNGSPLTMFSFALYSRLFTSGAVSSQRFLRLARTSFVAADWSFTVSRLPPTRALGANLPFTSADSFLPVVFDRARPGITCPPSPVSFPGVASRLNLALGFAITLGLSALSPVIFCRARNAASCSGETPYSAISLACFFAFALASGLRALSKMSLASLRPVSVSLLGAAPAPETPSLGTVGPTDNPTGVVDFLALPSAPRLASAGLGPAPAGLTPLVFALVRLALRFPSKNCLKSTSVTAGSLSGVLPFGAFGATRASIANWRGSLTSSRAAIVSAAGAFARITLDARRRLSISAGLTLVSAIPSLARASSYSLRSASGLRTSPALATVSCSTLVRVAVVRAVRSVTNFSCAVSAADSAFV